MLLTSYVHWTVNQDLFNQNLIKGNIYISTNMCMKIDHPSSLSLHHNWTSCQMKPAKKSCYKMAPGSQANPSWIAHTKWAKHIIAHYTGFIVANGLWYLLCQRLFRNIFISYFEICDCVDFT